MAVRLTKKPFMYPITEEERYVDRGWRSTLSALGTLALAVVLVCALVLGGYIDNEKLVWVTGLVSGLVLIAGLVLLARVVRRER